MRSLSDLQQEMRIAFMDGAPGMLVSALVWLAAAIVYLRYGMHAAVWTLLIGGAFIHPISLIALKALGRTAKVAKDNALPGLAMSSTIWLIVGCVLSYGLYTANAAWFFPAMLLVIGSRYLAFQTIYGHSMYLTCGVALIAAGVLAAWLNVSPGVAAFIGSGIEALFAAVMLFGNKRVAT